MSRAYASQVSTLSGLTTKSAVAAAACRSGIATAYRAAAAPADRRRGARRCGRSVLVLDHEVGAADRSGQLRLLPRELEAVGELFRHLHPVGELEADRALAAVLDGVQDVDRQAALVEDVGPADALDLERGGLERPRRDHEVALLLQDPVHPVDRVLRLVGGEHREVVVVLVLEVARLVRPQSGERRCDGRRLEALGGDGGEVDGVRHDAPEDSRARCRVVAQSSASASAVVAGSAYKIAIPAQIASVT